MNEHSDPISFLIEFAWANGADRFVVNNAKDQLKKIKEDAKNSERWIPKFNPDDGLPTEEHIKNFMLAVNLNVVVEEDCVVILFPYIYGCVNHV